MFRSSTVPPNFHKGYFGGSWSDGHSDVPSSSSSVSLRKASFAYCSPLDPDKGMTKYNLL